MSVSLRSYNSSILGAVNACGQLRCLVFGFFLFVCVFMVLNGCGPLTGLVQEAPSQGGREQEWDSEGIGLRSQFL